jgi:hypothetical protein
MYYEERWRALRDEINARGANGTKFVEAMQDYYTVFEDKALLWLGGLFDPDIGGFYYSESARDNELIHFNGKDYPFMPDIESTNQATNFLISNEIFKDGKDFPEWMVQKMIKFICDRQDPETGFFYHPQWGKELTDTKPSRRGRDLSWSKQMALKFDFKLPYVPADERLAAALCGKDEESVAAIPEYLRSKEKFIEYMDSLDFENKAYWSGNQIAAQAGVIKAAGLSDVCADYLDAIQKDTGYWGKSGGWEAVNGFLKISAFYETVGRPIKNAEKVVDVCVEAGNTREVVGSACFQYNVWFSIWNIISSLRKFGGADGNAKADAALVELFNKAPDVIEATKLKALAFKKPQGCFSMAPDQSSGTSQGMPTAVFYTNEGDINANGICSSGTARNIYRALEIEHHWIPIFSPAGREVFLSALKLPKEM